MEESRKSSSELTLRLFFKKHMKTQQLLISLFDNWEKTEYVKPTFFSSSGTYMIADSSFV